MKIKLCPQCKGDGYNWKSGKKCDYCAGRGEIRDYTDDEESEA